MAISAVKAGATAFTVQATLTIVAVVAVKQGVRQFTALAVRAIKAIARIGDPIGEQHIFTSAQINSHIAVTVVGGVITIIAIFAMPVNE